LEVAVSVQTSYPGVYIQELDSGVHTITGVATSITAFVGRAPRGPINHPLTVVSFADYVRQFGGLWQPSRLGFAVQDFFNNGGSVAVIVRLFKSAGSKSAPASLSLKKGSTKDVVVLEAASAGAWGNNLMVAVDDKTRPLDPGESPLFNLQVYDSGTGQLEVHRNIAVDTAHPRYIGNVLANESSLITLTSATAVPDKSTAPVAPKTTWTDSAAHVAPGTTVDDGAQLTSAEFTDQTTPKRGIFALDLVDLFNILVIPPYKGQDDIGNPNDVDTSVVGAAAAYCESRRAFYILDSPPTWQSLAPSDVAAKVVSGFEPELGTSSKNTAVFYPRLKMANSLRGNQLEEFAAAGAIAGVFAATDAQAGVWKAPAGLSTTLTGVLDLAAPLVDLENGELNPLGVNCVRIKAPAGPVVWGSRTLQGNDAMTSQWKYIPVRRFALFLEESLYRATQWVVFEPNADPLWAEIRLNITAFMQSLFRQGAFQGVTPRDAYFVKCDSESTQQSDIDQGRVNIIVGFAPLKPAEFVVISLQQIAGQATS
jgi:uncharacterized protein